MNGIESVAGAGGSSESTAVAQAQVAQLGLPRTGLAYAASAGTVNAQLATASWGVDPAAVPGAQGGAGAPGGPLAGVSLLPVLSGLERTTAEQALSLLGVEKPASAAKSASAGAKAVAAAEAASGSSGAYLVDPLWGKQA